MTQAADDPVPQRELPLFRSCMGRIFTDHKMVVHHVAGKGRVFLRINMIEAPCNDTDGFSTAADSGFMGNRIGTPGKPGYDRYAVLGEGWDEPGEDLSSVGGALSCTDDS